MSCGWKRRNSYIRGFKHKFPFSVEILMIKIWLASSGYAVNQGNESRIQQVKTDDHKQFHLIIFITNTRCWNLALLLCILNLAPKMVTYYWNMIYARIQFLYQLTFPTVMLKNINQSHLQSNALIGMCCPFQLWDWLVNTPTVHTKKRTFYKIREFYPFAMTQATVFYPWEQH